jgi:hypothetical protein
MTTQSRRDRSSDLAQRTWTRVLTSQMPTRRRPALPNAFETPFISHPLHQPGASPLRLLLPTKAGGSALVKQIEALKDLERPVIFCDLNSVDANGERSDIAAMRTAAQMLAEGVGILEDADADIFNASIADLPDLDRIRLQRPWAKYACNALYGSTPTILDIVNIVNDACALDAGARGAEDEWNSDIQKPMLKLALATSRHVKVLSLHSVSVCPPSTVPIS